MRIEAQGRYLQSILEKAKETLAVHTSNSPGLEAAHAELTELASKVTTVGAVGMIQPSSGFSNLVMPPGMPGQQQQPDNVLMSSLQQQQLAPARQPSRNSDSSSQKSFLTNLTGTAEDSGGVSGSGPEPHGAAEDEDGVGQESSTQFQEEMSANRLHTQGSGNFRQAHLVGHGGLAVSSSNSPTSFSSFHHMTSINNHNNNSLLSTEPDHVNNNNNNNNNTNMSNMPLERMRGYSSFHDMYAQSPGTMHHDSHVKVEHNPLDQNHNNSFVQCRGDNVDLNYGWERYIAS